MRATLLNFWGVSYSFIGSITYLSESSSAYPVLVTQVQAVTTTLSPTSSPSPADATGLSASTFDRGTTTAFLTSSTSNFFSSSSTSQPPTPASINQTTTSTASTSSGFGLLGSTPGRGRAATLEVAWVATFLVKLVGEPNRNTNDTSYSPSLDLLDVVSAADLLAAASERGDTSLLITLPDGTRALLYVSAPITFDTGNDSEVITSTTAPSVLPQFAGFAITLIVLAAAAFITLILVAVCPVIESYYTSWQCCCSQ